MRDMDTTAKLYHSLHVGDQHSRNFYCYGMGDYRITAKVAGNGTILIMQTTNFNQDGFIILKMHGPYPLISGIEPSSVIFCQSKIKGTFILIHLTMEILHASLQTASRCAKIFCNSSFEIYNLVSHVAIGAQHQFYTVTFNVLKLYRSF